MKLVTLSNLKYFYNIIKKKFEALIAAIKEKSNTAVCDNQYEFDNILTKDNNTIYLIKGDQDVWAAKDYVDELYDLMVELRNRVTVLESQTFNIAEDGNGLPMADN